MKKIFFTVAIMATLSSQFVDAARYYVDLHTPLIPTPVLPATVTTVWNSWSSVQQFNAFSNAHSWATAIPDLQYAMYFAKDGDEIWVKRTPANAPYTPMCTPNANFRHNYFLIQKDVAVHGGFNGTETSLTDRWFINQTHLGIEQHKTDYTLWMQGSKSLIDGFFIDFACPRIAGIVMESFTTDDNQVIANTVINGNVFKYSEGSIGHEKLGIINVGGNRTRLSGCGAILYNVVISNFILNSWAPGSATTTSENSLINIDGGRLNIQNVTIADNTADPRNNNPAGIPGLAVTLGLGRRQRVVSNPDLAEANIVNSIIWYRPSSPTGYLPEGDAIKLETFGYGRIFVSYSDIMRSGGSGSSFWTGGIVDFGLNMAQDPVFEIDVNPMPFGHPLAKHLWYKIDQNSPVIDRGINIYPECSPYSYSRLYENFDLKNEMRIENGIIDMGAFEWQPPMYNHYDPAPRRNQEENNENNIFQLYPNPANSITTLQIDGLESEATVFVTDMQGKVIEIFKMKDNTVFINVATYSEGVYFVRVISDKITATKKLIVKK
ncbi:MAG: T9SS type A sorting domain-containing protein [Prevotellaceae bacterium]|jgi:hypothetical protein|nr:T9SS type A sorting domain-containing protein [Prevotellaceae bacterium]